MSKYFNEILDDLRANQLTLEDLEALAEMLKEIHPRKPTEVSVLRKLRWHIATMTNTNDPKSSPELEGMSG